MRILIFFVLFSFQLKAQQVLSPNIFHLIGNFSSLDDPKNDCHEISNFGEEDEISQLIEELSSPYADCVEAICGNDYQSDAELLEQLQEVTPTEQASLEPLLSQDINQFFIDLENRAIESFQNASPELIQKMINGRRMQNITQTFFQQMLDLGIQFEDLRSPETRAIFLAFYSPEQFDSLLSLFPENAVGLGVAKSENIEQFQPMSLEDIRVFLGTIPIESFEMASLRESLIQHDQMINLSIPSTLAYMEAERLIAIQGTIAINSYLDAIEGETQYEEFVANFLGPFGESELTTEDILSRESIRESANLCRDQILSKLAVLNSNEDYQRITSDFIETKQAIIRNIRRGQLFSSNSRDPLINFLESLLTTTNPSREDYAEAMNNTFRQRRQLLENQSAETTLAQFDSWVFSRGSFCSFNTELPDNSHFLVARDIQLITLGDIHANHIHSHGGHVFAHEIGHAVEYFFEENPNRVSNETQDAQRSTRLCLRRAHLDSPNSFFDHFRSGPEHFVSEDYADLFAAYTIGDQINPKCSFMRNNRPNSGPATVTTPTDSFTSTRDSYHPSMMYRLLHHHFLRNGSLPEICRQELEANGEEFNMRRTCWEKP